MVTAVENDNVEALERLLQRGADVNANLDDDIGMNAPALQRIEQCCTQDQL